ncbi:MAG: TssQ family T6SS-associated lipoprotein [Comamonadaceae bacterium]|nr:TssQ family T6SS-associated lipoprotein [Comamonadaceae bacterium]
MACATQPATEQTQSVLPESNAITKEKATKYPIPVEPPVQVAPAESAPPEPSLSEKNLVIAITSFERGEYTKSMRLLSPLTTDPSLATNARLKAMKTLAFSQCLTGAVVACRGTFERAFKLDSKFDLAPAEHGHPVWGPQFERARKNTKN